MAVVLGTSSGFVTVAPTNDPAGTGVTFDGSSVVTKDTSPAGATTITEIGWYRAAGTNSANFEVALYSESAGIAATRLFVDDTNSDTAGGWVRVAVNWTISPSTAYWLGLQMDGHTGNSGVDSAASGGAGSDILASQTALNDPYGGGAVADSDGMYAIYALLASTASPNVSDSITVTDTPTVSVQDITLAINKSESITVTDTPIVLIPELLLNVSESITITDTPIVLIPVYLIDGFDSISVSESVVVNLEIEINVSDSITVTEAVTVFTDILYINTSDTISLTESITMNLLNMPNVSDSITITDTPTPYVCNVDFILALDFFG